MAKNTGILLFSCVSLFAMAIFGAGAVHLIERISQKWMLLGNSVAGGVLIGVALVHMLSENSEALDGWGRATSAAFGQDEEDAFPVGMVLAGVGFFLILAMESLLGGHSHEAHEAHRDKHTDSADPGSEEEGSFDDSSTADSDNAKLQKSRGHVIAGLGTWMGITLHTVVESVAMGAAKSPGSFLALLMAVLFHKTFAAFAVGSSLHGIGKETPRAWWALVLAFALAAPAGIVTGAVCGENLESSAAAALQCLAGGTLLAIGITELLLPALAGPSGRKGAGVFAATAAFFLVSLMALWA